MPLGCHHVGKVCAGLLGEGISSTWTETSVTRKGRSVKAQRVVLGVSKLVNVGAALVLASGYVFMLGHRGGKWCLFVPRESPRNLFFWYTSEMRQLLSLSHIPVIFQTIVSMLYLCGVFVVLFKGEDPAFYCPPGYPRTKPIVF